MSGRIHVTKVNDWLTPWQITVEQDGRSSSARFAAPGKAQTYALAKADETGLPLVYELDVSSVPLNSGSRETSSPRTVSPSEFCARMERRCAKCRHSKPLNQFREEWRKNTGKSRATVQFGWADRCLDCEAAA